MNLYTDKTGNIEATNPNYSTLMKWWRIWPEARPELLDFWARGGYVQRNIWRQKNPKASLTIGVRYIDEIEFAIRRLALLGIEMDFLWIGDVSPPSLIIAPQDADYDGVGGWGYTTCAGSRFGDHRGEAEWVPAMAWAHRMPDNLTDWIFEQASDFFSTGQAFVAPAESVGLSKNIGDGVSRLYESFSNTTTVFDVKTKGQIITEIDIPKIDGLSIGDLHKFCEDYKPELDSFRTAIKELIDANDGDVTTCVKKINDAVKQMESSNSHASMRKMIIASGGALAAFNLGLASGVAAKAVGAGFVAHGALQWWCEKTIARREARAKPFWPIWKMKKGKQRSQFREPQLSAGLGSLTMSPSPAGLSHWLAPPQAGWSIPSAIRMP